MRPENVLAAQFDDDEVATTHALLIDDVAEEIFQQNWNGVDSVVNKNAKLYRLSVESFIEWLAEECTDRTMAIDILAGANLRLHAKECATDFVEYCVAKYNIWA